MRKSCHWNGTGDCTGTLCKHDSKHLAGNQGIISVCLIEVTASEKQYSFRVIRLEGEELLHHRCFSLFFLCHNSHFNRTANLLILLQNKKRNLKQ